MLSSWKGRLLLAVMIFAGLCLIGASLGQAKKAPEPAPLTTSTEGGKQLPPGLANKPENHPGRMKHMQNASRGNAKAASARR
jgi:hypothetical protein